MPLYEYQCDACAHRFEVIQKYSDAPIDVCPKCGGAVKKLLSSPAIQFKGTGLYITDYARKGSERQQRQQGPRARERRLDVESKSESKSETQDRDEVRDRRPNRRATVEAGSTSES